MPFKYPSMADRLIANSIVDEDNAHAGTYCWRWIGKIKINRSGMKYGVLTRRVKRGPRKGQVVNELAHRVALKEFKGRRMGKRVVGGHLCNNSLCINPAHLVGGSQGANVRKCVKDGRHRNGASAAAAERAAIEAANQGDYGSAYGHAQDAEILRRM